MELSTFVSNLPLHKIVISKYLPQMHCFDEGIIVLVACLHGQSIDMPSLG